MDPSDAATFLDPTSFFPSRKRERKTLKKKAIPQAHDRAKESASNAERKRRSNRNNPGLSAFRENRRTSQKRKSALAIKRSEAKGLERLGSCLTARGNFSCSLFDDDWDLGARHTTLDADYRDVDTDWRAEQRKEDREDAAFYESMYESMWNGDNRNFQWMKLRDGWLVGPPEECRYTVTVCASLVAQGRAQTSGDPVLAGLVGLPSDLRQKVVDYAYGVPEPFAPGVYFLDKNVSWCLCCSWHYTLVILPDRTARFDFWFDRRNESLGEWDRIGAVELEEFLYDWDDRDIVDYMRLLGSSNLRYDGNTAVFDDLLVEETFRNVSCTARRSAEVAVHDEMASVWAIYVKGIDCLAYPKMPA
eukprot:CAMPEP_0197465024 /NCGR_PEP_ID=MMETSP1175-20131217/64326_1 /TAXON_ID=1003142 /ORGANISM="Triceratium dubium, Strain CCMP147" /LENGTH=360 /DNA_ID=CAMNT_0043001029 /DNA_START=75 /DNA_END=1157 /DNA_ORIENTATION=-